jgi:hypothetical protein
MVEILKLLEETTQGPVVVEQHEGHSWTPRYIVTTGGQDGRIAIFSQNGAVAGNSEEAKANAEAYAWFVNNGAALINNYVDTKAELLALKDGVDWDSCLQKVRRKYRDRARKELK